MEFAASTASFKERYVGVLSPWWVMQRFNAAAKLRHFGVLYCFFVIGHDRRKILHCNVTRQPNALWTVLQLREAWGYDQPHRFLIFDRSADPLFTTKVALSG